MEDRGGHILKGPDMVLNNAVETSTSTERVEVLASDSSQPFRFTGREWDSETGMYYYRMRTYSPVLKRFITEDPIRFASGDVNFYRYVGNNLTNYIDPLGLDATVCTYNPKDKNPFGHIGIGVNSNQTVGKYPSVYPNKDGDIKTDKKAPKLCTVVKTTPEQDSAMAKEIALQMASLSTGYKFYGDSCVGFVSDVLKQGGISCPKSLIPTPDGLMDDIKTGKCTR